MTDRDEEAERLWGRQHPFERNHLQRSMTLLGLGGVFAVSTLLLAELDVLEIFGLSLVCAGLLVGLAAASRSRYVRETQLGFQILHTRDGRFVYGSATGFVVVALFVTVLVLG